METGIEVSRDIIGPLPEDVDGNAYVLAGTVRKQRVRSALGMRGKGAAEVRPKMVRILNSIRRFYPSPEKTAVVMRWHSDDDSSFQGAVEEYVLSQPWLKTNTEGYGHDGNSIAEGVNKKLNERCRVLLLQAAGNRKEFEELAIPAMEHAADVENFQPEAGPHTPAEKAGNVQKL